MDDETKSALQVRAALVEKYGALDVFDTNELQETFEVLSFSAPYVIVTRKSDRVRGTVAFIHEPRFYFGFVPVSR